MKIYKTNEEVIKEILEKEIAELKASLKWREVKLKEIVTLIRN